jgi:hypothetical protein
MTSLPDKLCCVVTLNGNPVKDMMLSAEFRTARKNPYSILFGPTNREGCACLDRATIILQSDSQMNLALMDFDLLDKVFTGIVCVSIMREQNLQNALRAFKLYKSVVIFSDHYENDLKTALAAVRNTNSSKCSVHAKVEPSTVSVLCE